MNVVIEKLDIKTIAYMRRIGAYGSENFKLMEQLKDWARKNHLMDNSVIVGIAHDGPNTPPEECRYAVGIIITTSMDLVGESKIQLGAILPGDYAVFTIPHMSEAISLFWSSVFSYREENNLFFDVKNQFLSVIKTN